MDRVEYIPIRPFLHPTPCSVSPSSPRRTASNIISTPAIIHPAEHAYTPPPVPYRLPLPPQPSHRPPAPSIHHPPIIFPPPLPKQHTSPHAKIALATTTHLQSSSTRLAYAAYLHTHPTSPVYTVRLTVLPERPSLVNYTVHRPPPSKPTQEANPHPRHHLAPKYARTTSGARPAATSFASKPLACCASSTAMPTADVPPTPAIKPKWRVRA